MSESENTFQPSGIKSFLVTGLGFGYLPIAPGTWGSGAAAGVYVLVAALSNYSELAVNISLVVMCVVSSAVCISLGSYAEKRFGKKDPGAVTSDEWAGQAVTMLGLPAVAGIIPCLWTAFVAFMAFRIFDIIKFPPARQLEKLPKGTGVLCDDIAAGVYANIVCQIILRVWPNVFGL